MKRGDVKPRPNREPVYLRKFRRNDTRARTGNCPNLSDLACGDIFIASK